MTMRCQEQMIKYACNKIYKSSGISEMIKFLFQMRSSSHPLLQIIKTMKKIF